ncbi:hypothetical protein ABT392_08230 [Paucibacter sp. JuS9]|uniref:hypothetical protein n=1 Tax=Paucibacter sp. JuS9 TaxID=3228748 RepID=UPI0037583A9A
MTNPGSRKSLARHHPSAPGGEFIRIRVMLGLAVEATLESLNHAQLAALVCTGGIYVNGCSVGRGRVTREDVVLIFDEQQGVRASNRRLELVASFTYALMDLADLNEPVYETPAKEHPLLERYLRLGRDELLALLTQYAWAQVMDFCDD